ncbi:MAG: polymer-forming cytoskeletal protein [Patescibacteria group bacterium]
MFQRPSPEIALSREGGASSHAPHDDVETVVGPSVHVEGDFASEGNILVKGTVSGNVKTSKLLTVEQGAKIFANVKAGDGIISGDIRGNVKVSGKLELRSTARIAGDIDCAVLVVEAGCLIQGKVSMDGIEMDAPKQERKRGLGKLKFGSDAESDAAAPADI